MSDRYRMKKAISFKGILLALVLALTGMQAATAEETKMFNDPIVPIPDAYTAVSAQSGKIVRLDYQTAEETKYAYVYLPYGYDESQSYDILYVMHGGGGSQESLFGGVQGNNIKNAIDHLIENGEMKPMIIVTPTFYTARHNNKGVSGSWDAVIEFPSELVDYLMPAVESTYSTYAETADDAGFAASRGHRAFSGFSMGSVTTWAVYEQCLGYFHDFIPISGDSWTLGMQAGLSNPDGTAQTLANALHAQGDPEFFIYAVTGSEDIAEPMMSAQIEAMKQVDVFRYTETARTDGNLTYQVMEGGYHDMPEVKMYLFHVLPRLWPNE